MVYRVRINRLGKSEVKVFVEAASKQEAEKKAKVQYSGLFNVREYDESLDGSLEGKEIIR